MFSGRSGGDPREQGPLGIPDEIRVMFVDIGHHCRMSLLTLTTTQPVATLSIPFTIVWILDITAE